MCRTLYLAKARDPCSLLHADSNGRTTEQRQRAPDFVTLLPPSPIVRCGLAVCLSVWVSVSVRVSLCVCFCLSACLPLFAQPVMKKEDFYGNDERGQSTELVCPMGEQRANSNAP